MEEGEVLLVVVLGDLGDDVGNGGLDQSRGPQDLGGQSCQPWSHLLSGKM